MKVYSMLSLTGESSEEYFIALVQCVFKMEFVTTRKYVFQLRKQAYTRKYHKQKVDSIDG